MRVPRLTKLTAAVAPGAVVVAMAAACVGPGAVTGGSAGPAPQATTSPEAGALSRAGGETVTPDPRVGAVFLGDTATHTCSGSVLASTAGDLILTAAHCLADGVDTTFVPGFGAGGGGTWHVGTVYLDRRWLAERDPQADYAIAQVSADSGVDVLAAAGGGLTLGSAPPAGSEVTVTGYPMGEGGSPSACRGVTDWSPQGFPSLACAGLTDGFSGAPWVTGSKVTGLVGGLDGGGCDDDVSYSPRFDARIAGLLARAEAGGRGDAAPATPGSDC
ncbi:trypsin-like peptidase domain-containing protein [Mycobacterium sp. TNTM28]|uniref:Trypsin-like peptidase domain-containing protein n=1 Tax=[Mycobacterium] fortunisiensis TaxID=2600579 RepID=A0ABS6KM64_9MYCO|nr:serine protease [[Mycobacterium] fortunisiensis]MBU9764679.1 trypsin-like peptidase domain-containing protein [[Mycobacterium] fortunisiensis]